MVFIEIDSLFQTCMQLKLLDAHGYEQYHTMKPECLLIFFCKPALVSHAWLSSSVSLCMCLPLW